MKARQRKKLRKNSIISFDVSTLPGTMDIDRWYNILNTTGIILWDSFSNGYKPEIFPKRNIKVFKIDPLIKIPDDWSMEEWNRYKSTRKLNFIEENK